MLERAREILDFFPIRQEIVEGEYVDHLWNSFLMLDGDNDLARPFLVMPFHLLFMLAIQNKVLRIYKEETSNYALSFTLFNFDKNYKDVLSPVSPLALAVLNESQIVDLLKLVNLERAVIKKAKLLIRNRNENLAHAKGGIERDPDSKVEEYMSVLEEIHKITNIFNCRIAERWIKDIKNDDDLNDFVESQLLESGVCKNDFILGDLKLFTILSHRLTENLDIDLSDLNFDDWLHSFKIGLQKMPFQTVQELEYLAEFSNDEKQFNSIQLLIESDNLKDDFRKKLLKLEISPEIQDLLKE